MLGLLAHDDHRQPRHLRDGRRDDDAAQLCPADQLRMEIGDDRREQPCNAPQHVRIAEQAELVDVVVAARTAGHEIVATRQRALDDHVLEPAKLRDAGDRAQRLVEHTASFVGPDSARSPIARRSRIR